MNFGEYLAREQEVIKELKLKGFDNPKEDEDLIKTTDYEASVNGKSVPARRFMVALEYRDPNTLSTNQVRAQEADEDWCETNLIPRIKKYGGLQHPIYITESGQVVHGHNRLWSWKKMDIGDIPSIVITDSFVVDRETQTVKAFSGNGLAFNNKVSQIICNGAQKNNKYDMAEAAIHIHDLFKCDPMMGGRNPSGKPFYDPDNEKNEDDIQRFNLIMDWLHPERFLGKGERTKIRKKTTKKKGVKKLLTFDDVTAEMVNSFGTSGVNPETKKRLTMEEWKDPQGNLCNIIGTAGDKERSKVRLVLADKFFNDTLKNVSGVVLGVYLSNAQLKASPELNDRGRKSYLINRLMVMNNALQNKGWPVIKKVRFFVQLNDPRDVGLTAIWDPQSNCFVDATTKQKILVV